MKRFFALLLAVISFSVATVANAEIVAQMTYTVVMPDVTREGLYTGEVSNGIPHGYGVFTATNSSGINWHYLGQWEDGQMRGQGGQYWDNGYYSIGIYMNNAMVKGTRPTSDGAIYLEEDEVVVPLGVYAVGIDIPAGDYSVRMADGLISWIKSYDAGGALCADYSMSQGKRIGKLTLKEGQTVEVLSSSVIFAPYKGLGFK